MFVPVACLACGKLFQVPPAAAGTEVACPWCKAATPALPVAGVPAAPAPPPRPPELLSLDDDPPPPAAPVRLSLRTALGGVAVVLLVTAATVAALGYGAGRIPPTAWAAFTPPDGAWTAALPGTPTAGPVEPAAPGGATGGGERYAVAGWYSGTTTWVGWLDLDPGWAKAAHGDRDGSLTGPVLAAERDRRKQQAGGAVVKEAVVRIGPHAGREVVMDTPRGQLVEWYIVVAGGPRPRLYFLGTEGKRAAPGGEPGRDAMRLFDSFRVAGE